MLYLTRKVGERIVINDTIEVEVTDIRGKTAKLGISSPKSARVMRKEVFDRIQQENTAAQSHSKKMLDWLSGKRLS